MAKRATANVPLGEVYKAIPHLLRFPSTRMWLDYDREADVLYISLQHPQQATDTESLDDEGVLLHYRGKELVGITVLDASERGT